MVVNTPAYTAVWVLDLTDDSVRLVLINTSGGTVNVGPLATDAESVLLTYQHGKAAHFSAWHATQLTYAGYAIASAKAPTNMDVTWTPPFDPKTDSGSPGCKGQYSVSVLCPPYRMVLYAASRAPAFLRTVTGRL